MNTDLNKNIKVSYSAEIVKKGQPYNPMMQFMVREMLKDDLDELIRKLAGKSGFCYKKIFTQNYIIKYKRYGFWERLFKNFLKGKFGS